MADRQSKEGEVSDRIERGAMSEANGNQEIIEEFRANGLFKT